MAKCKFYSEQERYNLVMECRKSGLSDTAWWKEKGLPSSTVYNWVTFPRKRGITDIDTIKPDEIIHQVQEVVKMDIVPDDESIEKPIPTIPNGTRMCLPAKTAMVPAIEITLKDTTIKFSNDVRLDLMKATLQFL